MTIALPRVVSAEEWTAAREALLRKEKEHTRAGGRLAAERCRMPMVQYSKRYEFTSPDGTHSLLDLFEGRRQLIVYHFMQHPGDEADALAVPCWWTTWPTPRICTHATSRSRS
ncbi:hypothetical protein GCM10027360_49870 [Amycolatopsis echigonensis]